MGLLRDRNDKLFDVLGRVSKKLLRPRVAVLRRINRIRRSRRVATVFEFRNLVRDDRLAIASGLDTRLCIQYVLQHRELFLLYQGDRLLHGQSGALNHQVGVALRRLRFVPGDKTGIDRRHSLRRRARGPNYGDGGQRSATSHPDHPKP